jgi:porin
VQVNPTDRLYLKLGVYEDKPRQNPHVNHGFDFSGGHGNGEQIGAEFGYQTTLPGAVLPEKYAIGTIYDTGRYSAPFFSPEPQSRRGIVYIQVNKTAFRPTRGAPQRLYLSSLYFGTAGNSQRVDYAWQGAALYFGLIPGRPDATQASRSPAFTTPRVCSPLYQERLAGGGDELPDSTMAMAELNYSVKLTRWATLTPNIQYVWNPDGLGSLAYPQANLKNAFVIGAQIEINVAKLLGLAPRP